MLWVLICTVHLTVCYCQVTCEFRVNPPSILCLNVKKLVARSRHHIRSLSDSNVISTNSHLVRKQTTIHPNWPDALRTKWLWVRITLLPLKFQIWDLLRARSFLTFRQTIGRGFTVKLVRDIITYSQVQYMRSYFLTHKKLLFSCLIRFFKFYYNWIYFGHSRDNLFSPY